MASGQDLDTLARLRRVRDRMDRDYARPIDIESLARSVHLSAGHLSRQFRLAYGESPYAYLMTRRIERAMTLLRSTPATVTEVCFAVGCQSLGFEVRLDVGYDDMRWITVGPAGQPDTAIVLHPVGVGYDVSDDEKQTLLELIAKGSYFGVNLAAEDLDATFAQLEAAGADIVQEPTDQDYGLRDAAVRDPAGNLLRIQQRTTHEQRES